MQMGSIVNLRMKLQHTATILLSVSIGTAIQLQCFCGAVIAAEEEPGVPVEALPVGAGPAAADSTSTDSAPNGSSTSADSGPNSSTFSEPTIPPNPTADQKVDSESSGTLEPKSSDVISPVVPPLNWVETSPRGAPIQGRILQVDTTLKPPLDQERESKDTDRESKGTLLGKIGKSLLQGGAKKSVPIAERPWWIPGSAFTDDSMVAPYHNLDIAWWDKRPMPNRPQWVRLAASVTRYWRGTVSEPCFVLITPMEQAPGNFTFRSRSFGGPRGWLQALSVPDKKGFPQYRYWLDQP